jgi:hypothetical protein
VFWPRSRAMSWLAARESSIDCPLASVRTAPIRSVPRICLSTYPAAPAMTASISASSSANEVSMRQATSGNWERISRQTVTPSPSGSRTSSTATSGRSAGILARAEDAVPASPTTVMSPSASSMSRTPRLTISWSSSRNTLIGPGRSWAARSWLAEVSVVLSTVLMLSNLGRLSTMIACPWAFLS